MLIHVCIVLYTCIVLCVLSCHGAKFKIDAEKYSLFSNIYMCNNCYTAAVQIEQPGCAVGGARGARVRGLPPSARRGARKVCGDRRTALHRDLVLSRVHVLLSAPGRKGVGGERCTYLLTFVM